MAHLIMEGHVGGRPLEFTCVHHDGPSLCDISLEVDCGLVLLKVLLRVLDLIAPPIKAGHAGHRKACVRGEGDFIYFRHLLYRRALIPPIHLRGLGVRPAASMAGKLVLKRSCSHSYLAVDTSDIVRGDAKGHGHSDAINAKV